jgi:AraC-like DNA-binding protein
VAILNGRYSTPEALNRVIGEHLIHGAVKNGSGTLYVGDANGTEECPDLPHERHPFTEICCVVSGDAEIWAGGKVYSLHEHDTLILPPGTEHSAAAVHWLHRKPESAYSRLLWIAAFPYGAVVNVCESAGGVHSSTPRRLVVGRHFNTHIQDLMLELKRGDEYSGLLARCRLLEALVWLRRGRMSDTPESAFHETSPPEVTEGIGITPASRARIFIEQNFDSPLSLDDIAAAACANKSHLCREFKIAAGITVIDYLTRVRMEAARRLLITGLPIGRVSELVGFTDPYYFSRVFRCATGLSPSDFRRAHKPEALTSWH